MAEGNRSLLLVEDEAVIALAETRQLERMGYAVITASTGEQAVAKMALSKGDIDLVLMDIDLGEGMDGTEAARRILLVHEVPVLFLSSHLEPDIVRKTEEITNYGYVVKSSLTVLDVSIKMALKLFSARRSISQMNAEIEAANDRLGEAFLELRESEKTYRSLFDNMNKGLAYCRMIYDGSRPVDFEYIEVNPSFESLTGLKDAAGKRVTELIPDVGLKDPELFEIYGRVAATGRAEVFEMFVESLGDWYSVSVYCPSPGFFVAVFDVVTRQKEIESMLRVSMDNLSSLVRDMPIGVLLQGPRAEIRMSNPMALELLGLSEDTLLGKTSFDPDWNVIHEDGSDFPGPTHPVPQAIALKRPVRGVIMGVFRPASRDRVWLSVDAVPQMGTEGAIEQVVCTFIDITSRREDEARIHRLLEEKERLLKEANHRIKNNLGAIASYLSLRGDAGGDEKASEIIRQCVAQTRGMELLFDKLYRTENASELSAADYLPSLVYEILETFGDRGAIETDFDIQDFSLDAKALSTIGIMVNELVTNSMKHAFADCDSPRIRIAASKKGGCIEMTYHDNGRGLPAEGGQAARQGFGMRLVSGLAEQLGGTLVARSEDGALFILRFGEQGRLGFDPG
jgi:two-component sensor histidine kinase/PAS domain-containing protein